MSRSSGPDKTPSASSRNESGVARSVVKIRLGQLIINEMCKKGEFKVPIHLALGHEAAAVAVDAVMENDDQLALSHRNVHYNLARSPSLKAEIDEYLLKLDGLDAGRHGSMNLACKEHGILYTSSILGNNLPVAAGMAFAKKARSEGGVVFVQTGDGAIEEGAFYESLMFMKSYGLAVVILVENNGWSLATRIEERRCGVNLKKLAEAFGADYLALEGNDVYDYIDKLRGARSRVVENCAPAIVEIKLISLGSWIMTNEKHPDGKFINYHAGPAPTVNLDGSPVIEESPEDPVYMLRETIGVDRLEQLSNEILAVLKGEMV